MRHAVGLDLSYTRSGLALVTQNEFRCTRESVEIEDKSFVSTVLSARELAGRVVSFVAEAMPNRTGRVHMEEPFPNAQYSAGLYSLDTIVYLRLIKHYMVKTYNPTTLKHLIGHRSPKKSESVDLALKCVQALGLEDRTGHRICHDEAEALLYAISGGASDGVFTEDQISQLRALNPRMLEGYDRERRRGS